MFIVVLFTWAALTPEDDGFNTLLGGAGLDDDDEDDDDEDVRYDGTGYEGRDKALAGGSSGASNSSSSSSNSGTAARSNRAADRD